MQQWPLILIAMAMFPNVVSAVAPTTSHSRRPSVESEPVEKDGLAISLVTGRSSFSADAQPEFVVRFKNVGKDYRNLYDVVAYWNWTIQLLNTDPQSPEPGPWRLHMHSIPLRVPIEHRQIKPGESTDVSVDLNDPPFTFNYSHAANSKGLQAGLVRSTRFLAPGHYRLSAVVAVPKFPIGEDHHFWLGPVTTNGIELTIAKSPQKTETREELAACDAAIARVTDALQPGGLWTNGGFPAIQLPKDAKTEDVIDAAVNQTILDSKDYRVQRVRPFERGQMPGSVSGSAALVRVGKAFKVAILFPVGPEAWWSRFYDTELTLPTTRPAAAGRFRVGHERI